MDKLIFCMKCGKNQLQWDSEKRWNCQCGFTLYHNTAAAVAVVIRCGNEVLLTKRNQNPKIGKLDLAGGFVDPKESAETTCQRELWEEMKLRIDPNKLKYLGSQPNIYHYKGIDYNTLDLFYEYCISKKFELEIDETEISECIWFPINEVSLEEIAFESQAIFLKRYFFNNC